MDGWHIEEKAYSSWQWWADDDKVESTRQTTLYYYMLKSELTSLDFFQQTLRSESNR